MSSCRITVIGAGPAGMLAAGTAAEAGASVTLLEKMPFPGRKLAITGKGRCNLTNIAERSDFLAHFHPDSRFLRQAFHTWFSDDLLAFFHAHGVETVTERGGRVFPVSQQADTVVNALIAWLAECGVTVRCGTAVTGLTFTEGAVTGVTTAAGSVPADAVIVATGGKSYPGTGSTGDGYTLAASAGHTVTPIRPALIPLVTGGGVTGRLQGLSLRNCTAALWTDGKKCAQEFGDLLFTHFGLSGPVILTLSRRAVDALAEKRAVEIAIDLKPALDGKKLDARLLRDLEAKGKQQFKSILKGLLPSSLIPVCLDATGIAADVRGHQVNAAQRKILRTWLKDFRFTIIGHRPLSEAIITAGGVSVREIDPRSMMSRKTKDLFFAGEILDLDADTGGFNLQAAFSTGYLAGKSAAETVARPH